jgi:outer membrane receptor protein involved in Fe transport
MEHVTDSPAAPKADAIERPSRPLRPGLVLRALAFLCAASAATLIAPRAWAHDPDPGVADDEDTEAGPGEPPPAPAPAAAAPAAAPKEIPMPAPRPVMAHAPNATANPDTTVTAPPPEEKSNSISDAGELSLSQLLDPQITTASRVAEKSSDAPATVYVISKTDIRARGYSTLADVLKDLPGMETVEQYYSEQGTLVPVRGVVGNNKIVLLINGMRVNPPGGEELMIRNDVSVRMAEQIEVIYGPGSTLYGQDAISAVINIKTKAPTEGRGDVVGAYGLNKTFDGFASFGTRLFEHTDNAITFTGFASYRRSDLADLAKAYPDWWKNYEPILGPISRYSDPVRGDLGYSAFARLETKHASLQAWYRESQRSSTEGSGEGGKTPVLYFVDEAKWRDRSLAVEGQYSIPLSDGVALHSIANFNRYEVDPRSRYVWTPGTGLFLRDFKYGIGTSVGLEEKLDVELGDSTRLAFGVAGNNYDVIPKASVLDGAHTDGDIVSQAGLLTYYTSDGMKHDISRAVDLHYRGAGAYAEGSQRLAEGLKAIAGVRVDVSSRYSQVPVSPRAALVYNTLQDRLTLKYIFTQAFVAPAPYYSYNVFDNGVQISSGNNNLKPERATVNEVNAAYHTDSLLVSGSAYFNHQSDLLTTSQSEAPETVVDPTIFTNPDMTGPRKLTHSINLGTSNALGFDLSSRYNVSRFSFWGSYSFVDFKRTLGVVETGLPQISRHNVRAGFTLSVLQNLSVTPSLVFRSTPENLGDTYKDVPVSINNPYEVNLNAVYTPVAYLDAFITMRNLTNHHYALRGVAGPALQEPVSGFAGLRFKY